MRAYIIYTRWRAHGSLFCCLLCMMAICRMLLGKVKLLSLPILLTLLFLYLQNPANNYIGKADSHGGDSDNSVKSLSFRSLVSNRGMSKTSSYLGNATKSAKNPSQRLGLHLQCDTPLHYPKGSMEEVDARRTGYVLALSFHEQQTKATDNLFMLQCWAKTLFVNIVEPFVVKSHLAFPMNKNQQQYVKYREMFDIKKWQILTTRHKFSPLASWDQFVAKAPRRLIVVRFKYLTPREYKQRKKLGEKLVHLALDNHRYKEGCETSQELEDKIHYVTKELNFTIVRDVCMNFAEGDELTLFQFNRHVFGGMGPKTVTVLMEEWRGFGAAEKGKRIVLFDGCWLPTNVQSIAYMWPSQQLICDAQKYRHKYLRTESYIALMVRTEKIDSLTGDEESMAQCLNKTLMKWKKLKKASGIQKTFLSMDIGQYGSYSLIEQKGDTKYLPYISLYSKFFKDLFGSYATIKTWEMGFEEMATKKDPGYIASLQKTIAAMSKCIIFTGGGSFQRHAKYIYEKVNRNNKKCTIIIQECSRGI